MKDNEGNEIMHKDGEAQSKFPTDNIDNSYVAKIKTGKHCLILPLGAKANLTISDASIMSLPKGRYKLILTDISGIAWKAGITK